MIELSIQTPPNEFAELQARMRQDFPVVALDGRPYLQTRLHGGSGYIGYIQADCLQMAGRRVSDCKVVYATPILYGAEVAKAISERGLSQAGLEIGRRYTYAMRFPLPGDPDGPPLPYDPGAPDPRSEEAEAEVPVFVPVPLVFGDGVWMNDPFIPGRSAYVILNCFANPDHTVKDCQLVTIDNDDPGDGEFAVEEAHRIGRALPNFRTGRRYTYRGWVPLPARPE